jgi:hypothetical protein
VQHSEVLAIVGDNNPTLLHSGEENFWISRAVTLLTYRGYCGVPLGDQLLANSLLRIVIREEIGHPELYRNAIRVDSPIDERCVKVIIGDCGSHCIVGKAVICRRLPNDRIVNEALKVAGVILGSSLCLH